MARLSHQPKNYEAFFGLDVDKSSFSFTVTNHFQTSRSKKMPSNPEHLYNYIKKNFNLQNVVCAYEAGPTGYHLYDYLNKHGIKCFITSPASIPKASNERVKNNRLDSIKITDYLMSGKFKPIRVPTGVYRELRDLVKIRENYAHDRKAARQRIKALLLFANIYPNLKDTNSQWSRNHIKALQNLECPFSIRQRLDMLLEDLDYARKKLLATHRLLRSFCREHPEINQYMHYLQSIPGIGFVVAISILGKIGDPKELENPRELAGFIGLSPREKSTGDSVNRGSITHQGDKVLRFMLVEASWAATRKDTQLAQFFNRIRSKNNPRYASKIAITAVARKLTQIIYRVLKDEREYIQH